MANSERYIICKRYNPIPTLNILEFINVLNLWNKIDELNKVNKYNKIIINSILEIKKENTKINQLFNRFIEELQLINKKFETNQINNIQKTIKIIKYPPKRNWYKQQLNFQIKTAAAWCKKFNVPYRTFIHNLNYKYLYDLK